MSEALFLFAFRTCQWENEGKKSKSLATKRKIGPAARTLTKEFRKRQKKLRKPTPENRSDMTTKGCRGMTTALGVIIVF